MTEKLDFEKKTDFIQEIKGEPVTESLSVTDAAAAPEIEDSWLEVHEMNGETPDLDAAEVVPIQLASNYWTPTGIGEKKRVFFDAIKMVASVDTQTGEQFNSPCAFFYEKKDGKMLSIRNQSKRLVGILEGARVERGNALEIIYLGKKRNSTNAFSADDWSVQPLTFKK